MINSNIISELESIEGKCDIVIMPGTAEEVQEIVKIANKYKTPLVPWVSGINFGSIATPRKGGIVVDLRRLNRVIEVNDDDMYAVVEGGAVIKSGVCN